MKKNVAVVDYGVGNVYSVLNALAYLGNEATVVKSPLDVSGAERLILPGVGAFGSAMNHLVSSGLKDALTEYIHSSRPILGICLGFQLLFNKSEEGLEPGINILRGEVKRFPTIPKNPIPQMQWNTVNFDPKSRLFNDSGEFYFLHSYFVAPEDDPDLIRGFSHYADTTYVSTTEKNNVFGVQFHPEKSGEAGLQLLDNFMRI